MSKFYHDRRYMQKNDPKAIQKGTRYNDRFSNFYLCRIKILQKKKFLKTVQNDEHLYIQQIFAIVI